MFIYPFTFSHFFGCKDTSILENHRFKYFAVDGLFRNKDSFMSHKLCTFVLEKRIKGNIFRNIYYMIR